MAKVPEKVLGTDPVRNRILAAKNPFDNNTCMLVGFHSKEKVRCFPEDFSTSTCIVVSAITIREKNLEKLDFYPQEQLQELWGNLRSIYDEGEVHADVPLDISNGVFDPNVWIVPQKYKSDPLAK
ncbi:hypothetical protein LXL04_037777 [Taraxacum kok-saghyz]